MARSSGTAQNSRKVGRPAQGNNAIGYGAPGARRPAPAYRVDTAGVPRVIARGTLSHPKDIPAAFRGGRLAPDATPTVVQL